MLNIRIRVAGILMKEDKILLVRHEKNKNSYWLLPGGGVEFGETAADALIREFQEEVGLAIQIKSLVLVHDSIPPDKHRQVLNLYYLVTSLNFDLNVTPDAVLRDAGFYPLPKFKEMRINPDVKNEIFEGIETDWKLGSRYLGNRWKD